MEVQPKCLCIHRVVYGYFRRIGRLVGRFGAYRIL